MSYKHTFLDRAHKHCTRQRIALESSLWASCFYCERVFRPSKVEEWTDQSETAICPHCGIDSVLGDASGLPVRVKKFLRAMHAYWFRSIKEKS